MIIHGEQSQKNQRSKKQQPSVQVKIGKKAHRITAADFRDETITEQLLTEMRAASKAARIDLCEILDFDDVDRFAVLDFCAATQNVVFRTSKKTMTTY